MRRWAITMLALCTTAVAQDSIPSPDGRFIAYHTPNLRDGLGQRLFVRFARDAAPTRLLLQNDHYTDAIDAQWSPDSQFLAITNHTDPHITVVLVFGIHGDGQIPDAQLLFVSPEPGAWDIKWFVFGWDISHRSILLEKHVPGAEPQQRTFRIGTTTLRLP
jgi:hypothetical protein